jgi:hypothetical protein
MIWLYEKRERERGESERGGGGGERRNIELKRN